MRSPPPSAAATSSSTLWATASKEWVLPAKPKPGRKPKKEPQQTITPTEIDQQDAKERKVQNRAAQRAFRERKQNQLADLQARVQQYEQGEIERNVALQAVSKRLKDENDQLKQENERLLGELEAMRSKYRQASEKKRVRDDDYSSDLFDSTRRKRFKAIDSTTATSLLSVPSPSALSLISSPSPLASSPESCGSIQAVSPLSYATPGSSSYQSGSEPSHLAHLNPKAPDYSSAILETIVDCGFCSDDTPCVCRELALQQAASSFANRDQMRHDGSHPLRENNVRESSREKPSLTTSILDNLPAFQPPVPLPKRSNVRSQPIFRVVPFQETEPTCTGDPSNCSACADDPFGKAFCAALDDAVACNGSCNNCPRRCNDVSSVSPPAMVCRDSILPKSTPQLHSGDQSHRELPDETIPRADVWRQLKSHPNAPFADLRLLAEVVARSTACAGPSSHVVSTQDEQQVDHSQHPPHKTEPEEDEEIILTDPHARYHELRAARSASIQGGGPSLVPQEVLMKCGRDRILNVRAEGVRDALRILDSRFNP